MLKRPSGKEPTTTSHGPCLSTTSANGKDGATRSMFPPTAPPAPFPYPGASDDHTPPSLREIYAEKKRQQLELEEKRRKLQAKRELDLLLVSPPRIPPTRTVPPKAFGTKPPRRPTSPVDPRTLLVDPRLRGQLGMRPEIDSKLFRPASWCPMVPTTPPGEEGEEGSKTDPLARPYANSSRAVQAQIAQTKRTEFDPVEAVRKMMVSDKQAVRDVQGRVSAKALDLDLNTLQYENLSPFKSNIPVPTGREALNASPTQRTHVRPRARNSVPPEYVANRPPLPPTRPPEYPELDTVSIPYPQGVDDWGSTAAQRALCVGIASLDANLEDWRREKMFRLPLQVEDFDP
ncbi:hypothetical protein HKX48_006507 [Thoreauomyces humboldtii]|nr:hypothetical protein HKX48_006507 [Thoreauomyces humboldtii]